MGSAMAASLVAAGRKVHGFDVSRDALARAQKEGVVAESSCRKVAEKCTVLITSLPSASALHSVARSLGGRRNVVLETSTLPIEDKLAARDALAKKGIALLDCPLSGTGAQARKKDLVVLASGDRKAFAKAEPLLDGFSRSHYYLGEFGNGSRMKFVANLLVAIHNVAAAEAFALGMKAGLPAQQIYRVIVDGAGSSRMFQVRGPLMVAGNYPAQIRIDVWQKDMKIIGEFAARLGVATPLFSATGPIYNAAMAQGFGEDDTAAVCAVIERLSGVKRRRHG
ncbi:MAG: NAD(P)-dependent oxidoreductase [Betaproteobacteria bacterium]|nr:NAD(P)-dependent oxidoreductase [Betaproteobacteria bacterium]